MPVQELYHDHVQETNWPPYLAKGSLQSKFSNKYFFKAS